MTNYVNWVQLNQPIKGDVLQMEGNPVSDTSTPASGTPVTAPEGAQYASVWATVATQVQANNLEGVSDAYQNKIFTLPANTLLQIPNVTPNVTTIEMTDVV